MNFVEKSIEIIQTYQDSGGAYIAGPYFSPYQYGWFRDGVYTAYAMDLYGYHQSAENFYDWGTKIIEKYSKKINRVIQDPELVLGNNHESILHCRFTLEGDEIIGGWSTHQLDGLGLWLWGIIQHCRARGLHSVPERWRPAISLVVNYIKAVWIYPCADCWEENDDQVHTYTLAALAGGLESYQEFTHSDHLNSEIEHIKQFIARQCLSPRGFYQKSVRQSIVDANLLGLVFPFKIITVDHPSFLQTLTVIEEELRVPGGGLKRFPGDTFYGGGEWILLTAWLGSIYCALGEIGKAVEIKNWIENQFDSNGSLPEQVVINVQDQTSLQSWISKWGPPAVPLLWSHANYLILCDNLNEKGKP